MLARYRIVRGARAEGDPLPDGIRQDTRSHTRHVLRPSPELVRIILPEVPSGKVASAGRSAAERSAKKRAEPASEEEYARFAQGYRELIQRRFAENRAGFDELAELATQRDVYLGCNCPTARQPDVRRCHTVLALEFMRVHYPALVVRMPRGDR